MAEAAPTGGRSRRSFIEWLFSRSLTTWLLSTSFGGLVLSVVYPAGRYLIPPEAGESAAGAVTLSIAPDDIAPNSAQVFKFGSRPGLLLRTAGGDLRAFSATCTHLGCIVQYRPDLAQIWCACHNGHFDLNGHVVAGPPPEPLEAYTVNVRGDQIVVSRGA